MDNKILHGLFYYDMRRMKSRRNPQKWISGKGSSQSAPLEGDRDDHVFHFKSNVLFSEKLSTSCLPISQHDKTTSS